MAGKEVRRERLKKEKCGQSSCSYERQSEKTMKNYEELQIWKDVCQHDNLSDRIVSLSKQIGSFIRKLKRGRVKESTDQNE